MGNWGLFFNALVLINVCLYLRSNEFTVLLEHFLYVLSNGIVIWRAWVICSRVHRNSLRIPITFLVLTAVAVFFLIVLQIISGGRFAETGNHIFAAIIEGLQMSTLVFSLISNLSAKGIITFTAWAHRQNIRVTFQEKSKSDQVLLLLVESRLLYCISSAITGVALFIQLPHGTLGNIYTPINVQIAVCGHILAQFILTFLLCYRKPTPPPFCCYMLSQKRKERPPGSPDVDASPEHQEEDRRFSCRLFSQHHSSEG
ncbi:hypothetical protein DFH07DRAFT_924738 [Mycena maculata]|uniref:Uncharacterized protein n=1 Tax=Mycena maculata TaxID=230809 RepID=A0AAD7N4Q5_9AGAR|nr:hypothetical protein DFH07DRAFT_924738 [Mycena maculata]